MFRKRSCGWRRADCSSVLGLATSSRGGMFEMPEGLRLGTVGGKSTLLRWDAIARFDHSRVWPHWFVLAIAPDGTVSWIRNTSQRARIAWDDGETRDITPPAGCYRRPAEQCPKIEWPRR